MWVFQYEPDLDDENFIQYNDDDWQLYEKVYEDE
jgi:hypothetical protein